MLALATGMGVLAPELARAGMRRHTTGSWVALPPTLVASRCPQRWLTPPPPTFHELPDAPKVQRALLTALSHTRPNTGSGEGS